MSTSYSLALLEILPPKRKISIPYQLIPTTPFRYLEKYNILPRTRSPFLHLIRPKLQIFIAHENSLELKLLIKLSDLISILLNKFDLAESLSYEYLKKSMGSPWGENIRSVYHLALFHALLFRMTKKGNSEKLAKDLMDASLISHDPFFQNCFRKSMRM